MQEKQRENINSIKTQKSQIISVQASAGSGKTYSLVKRYLCLLLDPDNDAKVENIVAVTFTNKAAVEMKYRVIDYLKAAALSLEMGDFFQDLKLTKNEISKKSITILNTIFESYDNFNISTIDGFKNHILKSCAINVDLSPNFNIEQDYSDNLLFALEVFLKKTQVFKKFKKIILKYLSQYLIEDLGWVPKNDIYNEIERLFKKLSNTGKIISTHKNTNFKSELFSRSEFIVDKVKKLAEVLPKIKINFHHNKAVERVLKNGVKIFTSMNIPSRFMYKNIEYKKGVESSAEADKLWNEINQKIQSLCNFYMTNYYNIYLNIYSNIILEFDKQSKKSGIVFLNEINKKTVNFFEKNDNIMPEVYYRLSEKYKHFLIDEFQDTSFVQWSGIKRFLEESLACGGTFFYVGDVKQAIYAFRGGKSEVFDMVSKEFPLRKVDKTYLTKNFRSGEIIVNFNNKIFSKENIKRFLNEVYKPKHIEFDFSKFIEMYSFSEQTTPVEQNYGYVEINLIDKHFTEHIGKEIKERFINYIFDILSRFDLDDIAVLCRTNDEIGIVSTWLLDNNFEVESSQTLNIKNNKFIKQIISLMKFINFPTDMLSFSSFIIGDIFTKVSRINKCTIEQFIFIHNNKIGFSYKIFKKKYENLWNKYFEYFFLTAGYIPVYELTLVILEKFKIIDNFPDTKVFIMRFLEFIKDFEVKENSELRNFLEFFDNLKDDIYVKNAFGSGIKIMTIHKAKGLQFPVVIIPFFKISDKNIEKLYCDDSSDKIKLFRISENIIKFSPQAKDIYINEKINSMLSELNTLYVSTTRAKYELYAIISKKSYNSSNLILKLLSDCSLISGTKQKINFKKNNLENTATISDTFIYGYKDVQKYLKGTDKKSISVNNFKQKGSILHYALSRIISLKNKNINKSIDDAVNFTKRFFFSEKVEFVREKLINLFASEKVLNLFLFDEYNIYNEKKIVNSNGEVFRIDKLIIDKNVIMIVDFKSFDYDSKKNKNQLELYASLIAEIYPNKTILTYIVNIDKAMIICYT
ncbi:MAG: UvrD-helicase domain-containing protein [Endomicrobium sp.]|nr:UvrD-helicase domain-containing protein [Endomicrobium sp.]